MIYYSYIKGPLIEFKGLIVKRRLQGSDIFVKELPKRLAYLGENKLFVENSGYSKCLDDNIEVYYLTHTKLDHDRFFKYRDENDFKIKFNVKIKQPTKKS